VQTREAQGTVRTVVKRPQAETYLLFSLAAFAGSVIATRLFLELTGYPQIGTSELHIAHALWGGLLLLVAALLPLILANGWAFVASAICSGLGVGLFIDEIGKFITQKNDYFFPPAAPVVYAFFLVMVLLFLLVRRQRAASPRAELYRALTGLGELLDNNLDTRELEILLARLEAAQQADQPHVAGLAAAIDAYLRGTDLPLLPAKPSFWKRAHAMFERWGRRIGRRPHRILILLSMAVLSADMIIAIVLPVFVVVAPETVGQRFLTWLVTQNDIQTAGSRLWFYARILLEGVVGFVALISIYYFVKGRELRGAYAALLALLMSLTGVLLLSFYLDQFSATAMALIQFGALLLVLAYRRWYLEADQVAGLEIKHNFSTEST
jgi:hypothetical protein